MYEDVQSVPTLIDWTEIGAVTSVKAQFKCKLIECGSRSHGCRIGSILSAYDFITRSDIKTDKKYSYKARKGRAPRYVLYRIYCDVVCSERGARILYKYVAIYCGSQVCKLWKVLMRGSIYAFTPALINDLFGTEDYHGDSIVDDMNEVRKKLLTRVRGTCRVVSLTQVDSLEDNCSAATLTSRRPTRAGARRRRFLCTRVDWAGASIDVVMDRRNSKIRVDVALTLASTDATEKWSEDDQGGNRDTFCVTATRLRSSSGATIEENTCGTANHMNQSY
ncbi:LOB domain-containing protein 21 [Phtheirospermum japonicum]|uniref:LOB domain-containing protein 21 n=1 Tax=Phtheirospermum japonicum TaxID=374723 RepID=A0A830CJK1_9LAMI|nr:LOB domain-containing protein 21 [Phtheirospermum japonicum]